MFCPSIVVNVLFLEIFKHQTSLTTFIFTVQCKPIKQILLYEVGGKLSFEFTQAFDETYPLVDPESQSTHLHADITYVHCLSEESILPELFHLPGKKIRFIHDHKILCPREHKYTAIHKRTCTQAVGINCLTCCGLLVKKQGHLKKVSLHQFKQQQQYNRKFDQIIVASTYLKQQF